LRVVKIERFKNKLKIFNLMDALRIFILDSKAGKTLVDMIEGAAEELQCEVEITLSTEPKRLTLPRDYDGYLIHLSDTSEGAIRNLREGQSWSKIFGISGSGINQEYLEDMYYTPNPKDATSIVRKIRGIYHKD
jgi:hypothetical protein